MRSNQGVCEKNVTSAQFVLARLNVWLGELVMDKSKCFFDFEDFYHMK